jgi:hypothetical protein
VPTQGSKWDPRRQLAEQRRQREQPAPVDHDPPERAPTDLGQGHRGRPVNDLDDPAIEWRRTVRAVMDAAARPVLRSKDQPPAP